MGDLADVGMSASPSISAQFTLAEQKTVQGTKRLSPMTTLFSAAVGYSELNLHSTQRSQKHFTHSIYTIAVRQPSID